MRVLTQNLWGVRGAWELRRKVIQQGLAELNPDVVSLQEAINTPDVPNGLECPTTTLQRRSMI
jgi:endonuclease/exonuclease/phosphatase family metal-dependent hydrolase